MNKKDSKIKKSYERPERELLNMDLSKCTGCRSCEIACSFHHHKNFSLANSSIKIFRDNKNGEIEYFFKDTCDLCENEKIPLCVTACSAEALYLKK